MSARRNSSEHEVSHDPKAGQGSEYAPAAATLGPVTAAPDLFSEELTVTTLRAGAVLIVLFQTAYLFLDLGLERGLNVATLPLHLANIAVGVIGFFMVLTP